jgi:hypothetical protein
MLHTLGFSLQKARFVSDHLDAVKRLAWLEEKWPAIFRAAKRCKGLILFEDEASLAQWGSWSYTWARRGHQPEVPTRGKRQGYQVFGAIEYFSGRLFSQSIEGRFHSETYQSFLHRMMEQPTEHLFLIHDGARYHTSASTQAFLAAHRDRITAGSVTKRLLSSTASKAHGSASCYGMDGELCASGFTSWRTVPPLFPSCLAVIGALDRDAQKPFGYASS